MKLFQILLLAIFCFSSKAKPYANANSVLIDLIIGEGEDQERLAGIIPLSELAIEKMINEVIKLHCQVVTNDRKILRLSLEGVKGVLFNIQSYILSDQSENELEYILSLATRDLGSIMSITKSTSFSSLPYKIDIRGYEAIDDAKQILYPQLIPAINIMPNIKKSGCTFILKLPKVLLK